MFLDNATICFQTRTYLLPFFLEVNIRAATAALILVSVKSILKLWKQQKLKPFRLRFKFTLVALT